MQIEVERFGGVVVRWPELDVWLLVAPDGTAHWVMLGRVLGRAVGGST
jgi:hypothetical protein